MRLKTYFLIINKYFKYSEGEIEKEFAGYMGLNCCFTYSGRSALYLIYKSLRINRGEIITTPLTCSAAIFPIIYCGLKPKFIDICPESYNIQPDKINEAISKDTKAVQVIHLAGNPCDMKPIKEICEDHKLILIEDCAQALGAEYHGEKVGTFGDISFFSFAKPPLCIRGGIIVSKHQDIISKIDDYQREFLSNMPISVMRRDFSGPFKVLGKIIPFEFDDYRSFFETFLYRPNKLLSSMALLRLSKLQTHLEGYAQRGHLLSEELEKLAGIKLQKTTKCSKRAFTKLMLETDKNCVDVIKKLREKGIYATHLTTENGGIYQQRFDKHPLYSKFSVENCKNYLNIHDRIISLPISLQMNKDTIDFYCEQLDNIINNEDEK